MSTLTSHVSRDYKAGTPVERKALGDDIIKGIGDNPSVFTVLTMPVADYKTINDKYRGLATLADGKGTTEINNRNPYYDLTWLPATEGMANNVDTTAAGVKTVVDLSGFQSTKDETVASVKPAKMLVAAESGTSGEGSVAFGCKTKLDAKACLFLTITAGDGKISQNGDQFTATFYGTDGETIVGKLDLLLTTSKSGEMTGLERKLEIDIQGTGVSPAGCGALSNKANVVVP